MVAERRLLVDTQEALDWLDKNQHVEQDEFEAEKELEGRMGPLMMKVYQAAAGADCQTGSIASSQIPEAGWTT